MNPLIERILIEVLRRIVTPEMIQAALKQLVEGLRELAKKSDNSVDDAMVDAIAEALGVK